jgi:hypothetical protein
MTSNFAVRASDSIHARLLIKDGERAIVGSSDLSIFSAEHTEAAILTEEDGIVTTCRGFFDRLWDDRDTKPVTVPP